MQDHRINGLENNILGSKQIKIKEAGKNLQIYKASRTIFQDTDKTQLINLTLMNINNKILKLIYKRNLEENLNLSDFNMLNRVSLKELLKSYKLKLMKNNKMLKFL